MGVGEHQEDMEAHMEAIAMDSVSPTICSSKNVGNGNGNGNGDTIKEK